MATRSRRPVTPSAAQQAAPAPAAVAESVPAVQPQAPAAVPVTADTLQPAVAETPARPARTAKPAKTAKTAKTAVKAKAVAKPKAAGKAPVADVSAPAVKPAKPIKEGKDKAVKLKVVRDSFTIPKAEYAALQALKERAIQSGHAAKKSELLRAGLQVLAALPEAAFLAAVKAVEPLKTGRPAKD